MTPWGHRLKAGEWRELPPCPVGFTGAEEVRKCGLSSSTSTVLHWTIANERLSEALIRLGRVDVTVDRREVETAAQAEQLRFAGSPTIRIDNRDPFATGVEQTGLACRVYHTPAGLEGSPTVEQLIEVLSSIET